MVKLNGPMFSLSAAGKLAGAIVYSSWKGRPYARELVKPSNPRSGGQLGIRGMFAFLTQVWAGLGASPQATWEDRAKDRIISPFNAFCGYNLDRWRNFTGPTQDDPAVGTGTPSTLSNEDATAGERSITVSADTGAGADQWGVAIFRSLTGTFTTGWDNCIAVIEAAASGSFSYIDSPLDPDTYYYNFRPFTDEGLLGAEATEVNAEVT